MSRPKSPIDWEEMGKLIEAGCTGVNCADYLGIDSETFYNRCKEDLGIGFTEFLRQKRSKGDARLLEAQFNAALQDKDRGMLIWLGKQRLGQKDKHETESKISVTGIKPIEWVKSQDVED